MRGSDGSRTPGGLWITLEGGDGAGKTTQAALLQERLEAEGRTVLRTREPGGTAVGRKIREIVLHHRAGEHDDGEPDIGARAEALLYAADRAHHIDALVKPALARGEVVIQDRYLDSSVAYQGSGRVLGADEVRNLSLWATEGALPDLTVLLDIDTATGRARLDADDKPFDRLESEEAEFHTRVREGFLALAAAEPERFLVLDAAAPRDELAAAIGDRVAGLTVGS